MQSRATVPADVERPRRLGLDSGEGIASWWSRSTWSIEIGHEPAAGKKSSCRARPACREGRYVGGVISIMRHDSRLYGIQCTRVINWVVVSGGGFHVLSPGWYASRSVI